MAQALSPMAKTMRDLSYRHGLYNVFADFCELSACSFSNAVDKQHYPEREQRYMTIVKKYSKDEVNEFPKLLGMLADQLEYRPYDVMGELFHELELHNEHAGQFFTPYPLCEMMAKMTYDGGAQQTIDERGYVTLQEPACGSGAMVIAFAKAMYDQKINFQQCLHVSAIDIDSRCVHMAYLQFSLLHIPAVVYAGNTLTMEMRDAWYTPAHIMGGWDWRLRRQYREAETVPPVPEAVEPVVAEPAEVIAPIVEPVSKPVAEATPPPATSRKAGKKANPNQLTIF